MILGRTRDAREEVAEEADEVCSLRMVVLWAMQAYRRGVGGEEEEAIVDSLVGLLASRWLYS